MAHTGDCHTGGHTQEVIQLAHPGRITTSQIIIDCDNMNTFAGQRIEITEQGGNQRLTFPGAHLGNLTLVQHHATDQLHVEVTHVQCTACTLARYGERFRQ